MRIIYPGLMDHRRYNTQTHKNVTLPGENASQRKKLTYYFDWETQGLLPAECFSREVEVMYPAVLRRVPESLRFFPRVSGWISGLAALEARDYAPYRQFSNSFLWRTPVGETKPPEYVLVVLQTPWGYLTSPKDDLAIPLYICIPNTKTLLTFCFCYHLPLQPESSREQEWFEKQGYEGYRHHLDAVQTWSEEEHGQAAFILLNSCLAACGYEIL